MKVVTNADHHCDQRRPAKPVHRARHHHRVDLAANRRVELLHGREVDQIEKIEEAYPDDSEDEVQPSENDEFGHAAALRKTKMWLKCVRSGCQKSDAYAHGMASGRSEKILRAVVG